MDERTLILLKPVIQERIEKFSDINGWLVPFLSEPECNLDDLKYKSINSRKKVREVLEIALSMMLGITEDLSSYSLESMFRSRASLEGIKAGDFFFPIRVSITGSKISLPLFETMEALGKEEVVNRLSKVIKRLER